MDEFFCQTCVAAMPAANFWIVFIGAIALTLLSLHHARKSFVKARLIEDMPTSQVRSASQGYVELIGTAAARGNQLVAPLTGQQCLWWRYTIERHQKSGKSSSWRTIDKGASDTPFYMADATGSCRVDPAGAEISCLHKKVWRGSRRVPTTSTLSHRPGLMEKLTPLLGGGRYRYSEFIIREGDPLYLLGHFVSDATGQRILTVDQVAGQIIRQWKKDFDNLLVTYDSDGNGVLDQGEWAAVQDAARAEARKRQLAQRDREMEHSLVKPEQGGLPYLIGSHGQETLSSRFRWHAIGGAVAFLAFGAGATWLVTSRFVIGG